MFGKNEVRKREGAGFTLQVREVFYTIQGEGPYMGMPAVFVRLTGCTLRCFFCDTEWDDANDPTLTLTDLIEKIQSVIPEKFNKQVPLIVLTGGEPMRQALLPLAVACADIFPRTVLQIETSGSVFDPVIYEKNVAVVCSPKTPKVHEEVWRKAAAFKYVVQFGRVAQEDGLPVGGTQPGTEDKFQMIARPRPGSEIFISPCDEYDRDKNLANYKLAADIVLRFGYRLSLQMHKLVGVP